VTVMQGQKLGREPLGPVVAVRTKKMEFRGLNFIVLHMDIQLTEHQRLIF
jgi:hypothetical protein